MTSPIDIASLPGPAQKLVAPDAPPKLQELAAKGIAPGLKPAELLAVVVILTQSDRAAVHDTAVSTIKNLPAPILQGALATDLEPAIIHALAQAYIDRVDVIEKLVVMPRVSMDSIEHLARAGTEAITEIVATNETRLLQHPRIIELLYMNRATRMSTADRIVDLARRNGLDLSGIPTFREAAQALEGELIYEPSEEPTPDDLVYAETEAIAEEIAADAAASKTAEPEDTHVEKVESGEEVVKEKFVPLHKRIADMSISQKVRRATLGTKEERLLLVRERNRLVCTAVARSPMLQEDEVDLITKNRNISEDVLKIIGTSGEWLRSYSIKKNLAENPKTPPQMAIRFALGLRESDMRNFIKNRNVSAPIRDAVRKHLQKRK
ncbi:MAG: hypothetical protein IPM54_27415 [Polyangiaceae bacterium]|nr:hypothetical protein [Polyangiaceae bacterium]